MGVWVLKSFAAVHLTLNSLSIWKLRMVRKAVAFILAKTGCSQRDGSAWPPEFDSWNPHGRKTERLPPVVLCLYSHGGTCKIKMTLGSNLENKAGQMAEILTFYPQLIFWDNIKVINFSKKLLKCVTLLNSLLSKMPKLNDFFLFKFQQYSL